ncbi:MAG TPA: hypothetical protein VLC98_17035 [Phnomibacter sp.]|nr:hypothetical protein [Phnomibacter sp.]
MRKVYLLFSLAVISFASQAQIEKKNVLFGGSFGFNIQESELGDTESNSNLLPFVQYAYKNNRTIGFNLDFHYSSNTNVLGKYENFSVTPGINFTQYFPLKGGFGWWLQEGAGVGFSTSKYPGASSVKKSEYTYGFVHVTPGLYYAIGEKKNWLLQASVGEVYASYSGRDDYESWVFDTNFFQKYRFGFAYVFK